MFEHSKFEVQRFDGKSNFRFWQMKARDLMIQQGQHKVLKKDPDITDTEAWKALDVRGISFIRSCVAEAVLEDVGDVTTAAELWTKLKALFLIERASDKRRSIVEVEQKSRKFSGGRRCFYCERGRCYIIDAEGLMQKKCVLEFSKVQESEVCDGDGFW